MTATPLPGRDEAMLEAASWKIRLNEAPDDEALAAACAAWRARSVLHEAAWRRVEKAWGVAGGLAGENMPAGEAVSSAGRQRPGRGGRWLRRTALGVAASVLVGAFGLRAPDLVLRLRADYVTGAGETRTLALPDGSTVILGPRSAIALHYAGRERAVALLEGEAFFTVVHDAAHGFSVTAARAVVRDIGTAFDVRLAGAGVAVAVKEGMVGISWPGRGGLVRLASGQQWAVDGASGREQRGEVDPAGVGAWASGHLVLDGMTLADAVRTLGRYYAGTVLTHGLERDRVPMGGVYDLHRPKEALEAISALHGGRVVSLPAGLLLVLPGPGAG
ncbi:DUF4880 domain-containing protein [Gluconacetobacter sp. 1b LMG 1731]|uniref:DUF4880 domain-containing protein n=1 Tax=Gluconacetobacter dulcium TaxID=2729096 RepID=A0A7W4IM51_9PROT|nr:FecR domain-containing protein [Gluconacetobacter dulcium]MBB2165137.1 DUF4880 domain-containing protein [Gluconacetobacter dulcium]MBB2194237.1 DUF4880 domain-containing protein [Gluconacetobacter dulcium]